MRLSIGTRASGVIVDCRLSIDSVIFQKDDCRPLANIEVLEQIAIDAKENIAWLGYSPMKLNIDRVIGAHLIGVNRTSLSLLASHFQTIEQSYLGLDTWLRKQLQRGALVMAPQSTVAKQIRHPLKGRR